MGMTSQLKSNSGFSLVELLFTSTIMAILLTAIFTSHLMTINMYCDEQANNNLYNKADYIIQMICRGKQGIDGLMKARSSTVAQPFSDQINFTVDRNAVYTVSTADDTQMSIYFDDGDGDSGTLEDNSIAIETLGTGGEIIYAGQNIENIQFAVNGDIITIQLTLAERVRDRMHRLTVVRDVFMRN